MLSETSTPWDQDVGQKQKKCFISKKKKGNMKVNAIEETSDDADEEPIAFMNFDCSTLIKDNLRATQIVDTQANTHMTHLNLLADYKNFPKPRKVSHTQWTKGPFEVFGSGTLVMPIRFRGKEMKVMKGIIDY